MKKSTLHSIMLSLILFISISAQNPYKDSLCSYTWSSSINDCPDPIVCISPEEWNGQVITIPANISRISPDSLKLCMGDIHMTAPTTIIYIMDLSSSMFSDYRDNNTANDGSIWHVVKHPEPGWENVGDPYRIRDEALAAGFQAQRDTMPSSLAGYIGFGGNLIPNISSGNLAQFTNKTHLVEPVNVMSGKPQLDQMVADLSMDLEADGQGTNYRAPIDKAIEWIQDINIIPDDHNIAIIFISDGNPTSGDFTQAQVNTLVAEGVKVHGIFLGQSMGADLQNLSSQTSGSSTLVTPQNMGNLTDVIKGIVESINEQIVPKQVAIQNLTTNNSASSVQYYEVSDTVWSIKMNQYIPLQSGINEIRVHSTFGSVSGYDTTSEFTFYLDIQDSTNYTSECYTCWNRTTLDVEYSPARSTPALYNDTLNFSTDQYVIKLSYFDIDTLDEAVIIVSTKTNSDSDTLTLADLQWNGIECLFSDTGTLVFTYDAPVVNNDTTESFFDDVITVTWRHPRDLLDTIVKTTLVRVPYAKIDSLRIVTLVNGVYQNISQLTMESNVDTTLFALGRRSDINEWIPVSVPWQMTPWVTVTVPPQSSNQWHVKPNGSSAMGIITIGYYFKDTVYYEIGTMSTTNYLPLKQQQIRFFSRKSDQGASIQIILNNYIESIEATLLSASGRKIGSNYGTHTKHLSFNIGSVSNGIYFLHLKSDGQSVVKKVLFRY